MNFKNEKNKIDSIINNSKNILITSHISPDLDAVGSVLSIKWYIENYFKNVKSDICITGPIKKFVKDNEFIHGIEKINEVEDILNVLNNYDLVIFLDGSTLNRFSNKSENIDLSSIKSICLDHHTGEPNDYTYYYRDSNYASCTQLITDILLTDKDLTNIELAQPLILGIYTDTGFFKFVNYKNSSVYTTTQKIVNNSKIDVQDALSNLGLMSELESEVLQKYITNLNNYKSKSKLPPFTYSYVNKGIYNFIDNYEVLSTVSSKIHYNFIRKIKGYSWGYTLSPKIKETIYKLSFRSLPSGMDVSGIARLFNGGGHLLAAGATIDASTMNISEQEFNKLDSKDICEFVNKKIEEAFESKQITIYKDVANS